MRPHLSVFDRGFQLGDGVFETLRAKGGRCTELAEHVARLRRSAAGLAIELPDDVDVRLADGIAKLLAAEGLDGPGCRRLGPDHRLARRLDVPRAAARRATVHLAPTIVIQAWPVDPPPRGPPRARPRRWWPRPIRRDPPNPIVTLKTTSRADYVYARLEARRAGADDARLPDQHRPPVRGHDREHLPRPHGRRRRARARDARARLRDPPRHHALVAAALGGRRVGLRPVEGWLTPDELATADEAFISSSVAGVLPVTRFNGHPIGGGLPGAWTRRARADREAVFGRG